MAPPHKIGDYLTKEEQKLKSKKKYDVPLFFERKKTEEKITNTLKEKETLLKEIHHRVKNNLQIISSLLKLNADKVNDRHFSVLVEESQNRIVSMALIHEMLYAQSDLSKINLADYSKSLFEKLQSTYSQKLVKLKLKIPHDFYFEIDKMIPVGLILNEVISNSFKYAFPKRNGEISISYSKNTLIISDNGIGIFKSSSKKINASFGLQLIDLLAEQIDAKVEIKSNKGTSFEFTFG
jgi:two-component sensor histidine kinase